MAPVVQVTPRRTRWTRLERVVHRPLRGRSMSVLNQITPSDDVAQSSLAARARRVGMNPNYWYPAEHEHRLQRGGVVETQFWNESIALFKSQDGTIGAVENRCAHRHIKLSYGSVVGNQLVCRYHGWSYDCAGALVQIRH